MRTRLSRAALAAGGAVALAAIVGVAGPAGAQEDPLGNNGTVKVDGVALAALAIGLVAVGAGVLVANRRASGDN